MKSKFVMTNNAKNFITLTNNLLNRGKNVSGMALVYGEPGVGKSHTALWWVANNDNAIHVQVTQTMTPRWLLSEIVKELGEYPAARTSDLFNQIVKSLILDPKILMIDEVDYLIDKKGFELKQKDVVLELPTHLSFPAILRKEGDIFVYPENGESGELILYHYFPNKNKCEKCKTIIDEAIADGVITKIGGTEMLFCTKQPNPNGNVIYIYIAKENLVILLKKINMCLMRISHVWQAIL